MNTAEYQRGPSLTDRQKQTRAQLEQKACAAHADAGWFVYHLREDELEVVEAALSGGAVYQVSLELHNQRLFGALVSELGVAWRH